MTTRADKRGDRYVINGKKHWITGGGVSRFHLIFARVFDEAGVEQGIGGFIALRDEAPGLIVGERAYAMGLRGIPETEIIFEDLELDVPDLAGLTYETIAVDEVLGHQVPEVGLPLQSFLQLLRGDPRALVEKAVRARDHQRPPGTRGHVLEKREHLHARQADRAEPRHVEVPDLVRHAPALYLARL